MTKQEYVDYQASVADFMRREGLHNLTAVSAEDGDSTEPYFSWHPCDCCGSPLGGNREDCQGATDTGVSPVFRVCEDCVYYAEYGRLDDSTMAQIEATQ